MVTIGVACFGHWQPVHRVRGFSYEPQVQTLTTQKINYLPPDNIPGLSGKVMSMLKAIGYLPRACLGSGQSNILQALEVVERFGTEGLGYELVEEKRVDD